MQIGTPGAAYGPGFSVGRPSLSGGAPLDSTAPNTAALAPFRVRPLKVPGRIPTFSPMVHHNELVNRVAALRVAQHPTLAGSVGTSPLMAAHARLAAPSLVVTPPPLLALPPLEAAVGNPKPRPPRGSPGLGGLVAPAPVPGLGDFGKPKARDVADLLQRAMLARAGRV